MRTRLEQSVLECIRKTRMLRAGDRVGVAVSGGADSVALLRLLDALRGELGVTLAVAHFNHSLRGDESEGDAQFVTDLARSFGVELLLSKEDVAAQAARNGWNLEDAARRLRYAFFQRLADENRVARIAVAHTADDQAETVLAHVIRGTGLTGLGGIHPVVGVIVRPLLGIRRNELRDYLKAKGQTWREDSTNQDLRRTRARIRAKLLPQLETEFSPQIVRRLSELSRLAREEELFWRELVDARFRNCVRKHGRERSIRIEDLLDRPAQEANAGEHEFNRHAWQTALWRPLTERVIRCLYEEVKGDRRELSAQNVEDVIHLATDSSSGHCVQLPGRVLVERDFDTLTFSTPSATREASQYKGTTLGENAYRYEVRLQSTGTTSVSVPELGSCFRLKVIDWPQSESETKSSGEALDVDLLSAPLILRNWQPGDAYRPYGRREARKLKELFRIARAAGRERASWPVLESSGRVIWTRGMPPAKEICATEKTRAGVVIEEVRL